MSSLESYICWPCSSETQSRRKESSDLLTTGNLYAVRMSTISKPEEDEALSPFNVKAERKMLLKLDLLLVTMCGIMYIKSHAGSENSF